MARTVASLPSREPDHGLHQSRRHREDSSRWRRSARCLAATGTASRRQRDLPAHVVVYYVIALALYMQSSTREVLRCLLEGVQWLLGTRAPVKVAGKSGISQARTRVGWQPLQHLHDAVVHPIAGPATQGAWYRPTGGWSAWMAARWTSPTRQRNARAFGRPAASRGRSAYPQLRFVALVENGTHVLFGTQLGRASPRARAPSPQDVLAALRPGMLCLADRNCFTGSPCGPRPRATGADLLWRVKKNLRLPCEQRLPDGSYLSRVYPVADRPAARPPGVVVRVVDYPASTACRAPSPCYRLLTTLLDPAAAAGGGAGRRCTIERWEIETAFDELKTHLRGARIVLRANPGPGRQEFYGLLLATSPSAA